MPHRTCAWTGYARAMTKHSAVACLSRITILAVLALASCMTSEEPAAAEEPAMSIVESAATRRICTPGAEMCDWGCFYVGGPSTDDCIVKCNATGTAWTLVENCGWAQNFPYSSSCLETQPHPVCQWN